MQRILLLGGGHAHLSVLASQAERLERSYEVIMITPNQHQTYSGMLPGWMAGHYGKEQVQIDLMPLLQASNVKLIKATIIGIDAKNRQVILSNSKQLDYDLLSVDVGSEINSEWLELAGDKLLPVKPLDHFFEAWPKVIEAASRQTHYTLVVVGGGAAGIELALSAQHALSHVSSKAKIHLIASNAGLLNAHSIGVQKRVDQILRKSGVIVHSQRAVGMERGVMLVDGTTISADCVLAATGARAPVWLKTSGLTLDIEGYILVDHFHRSVSHPEVFAAGDICARQDVSMARSGVHAVHAGPVIAKNLDATVNGTPLETYKPRSKSLYLLACGKRYAIASWGQFSAEGKWVWYWKDGIDRRFIKKFSQKSKSL